MRFSSLKPLHKVAAKGLVGFRDENVDKWVFCFSEREKLILMSQHSHTFGNLLSVSRQDHLVFSVHTQIAVLLPLHFQAQKTNVRAHHGEAARAGRSEP